MANDSYFQFGDGNKMKYKCMTIWTEMVSIEMASILYLIYLHYITYIHLHFFTMEYFYQLRLPVTLLNPPHGCPEFDF